MAPLTADAEGSLMNGGPVRPLHQTSSSRASQQGSTANGGATNSSTFAAQNTKAVNGNAKHTKSIQPSIEDDSEASDDVTAPSRPPTWPRASHRSSPDDDTYPTQQTLVNGEHEPEIEQTTNSHKQTSAYSDETQSSSQYPRLSRPVELLQDSYDCVVIGSGYGGAVAASRMARAGETVCVLELGKEKWPGEYPVGISKALNEVHWSGDFAPGWAKERLVEGGNPTGMYHLIFGRGQNAVVANGLGGTSLINANVWLEANPSTLGMQMWPAEIRDHPDALKPYYDKARKSFHPQAYPNDWPKLPKTELLRKQADHLGMSEKFYKVEQTTRFRNGPNHFGVEMSPSTLTGQDGTGVNDGSKSSTLVTYLADAWNWGAEMFCECEVRHIEKVTDGRGGYRVYFAWHGRNRGHFKANIHGDLLWVYAKKAVFLGGGSIGTTEILLRSKALGLKMSDQVGKNMSGNGDMLAFGYNTDYQVNAIGRPVPSAYRPVGPCITGIIDNREGHANPLDGYVIQEGSIPEALAPLVRVMLTMLKGQPDPEASLKERLTASLAKWGSWLAGPYYSHGAVERTQVYLVMSHDSNQAMLTLKNDKPVLEFLGVGRSDHVKHINSILWKATKAVGGTLIQNPFSAAMGEQEVTVHPIGGACMARDGTPETGVTNHLGEVFCNNDGDSTDTHRGLIVTDAAVIPCALGANPIATITALAERSVEAYCQKNHYEIKQDKNGLIDLFGEPKHHPIRRRPNKTKEEIDKNLEKRRSVEAALHTISKADALRASGFGFTEVMSGFLHYDTEGLKEDVRSTYELAHRIAKSQCEAARFFLSVQAFNTKTTVQEPEHKAMLTGTFVCPTIPGSPFMVSRGEFNLFKLDHKAPGTRNLTYDFDMTGVNGKVLHFHGYKVVDSSVALAPRQFWRSTSTLYVTISSKDPHDPLCNMMCDYVEDDRWRHLTVLARGMMHIQPADFVSELMTMTPTGSHWIRKLQSAASFMTFFTRKSLSLLLAPLTPLQYPTQSYRGYINHTPPQKPFEITASDGIVTKMLMWEPTHIPVGQEVKTMFLVPGSSVDHQIFALPTIPYNAINYFTRAGYRVYVTVHRIGQLMVAESNWTTFDARLDIKACMKRIRDEMEKLSKDGKAEKMYVVTHCMGSVAFSCGILDGTIPAEWVAGITCSQVFMNPMWNTANLIKALDSPIPLDTMYRFLAGNWFSCRTSRDDAYIQRLFNFALRFWPDERREICNNATCHRISLVFARCWNHRNLNEATHRQIDRFFGGVNMTLLHLLMRQGVHGKVTGNAPLYDDLTIRENVARLKGIPIMLFVGADNAVLSPESTEKTYEILCDTFGSSGGVNEVGTTMDNTPLGAGSKSPAIAYRRRVVPGYGHLDCWMGRNAWKDVYPFVLEEADRVMREEKYRFKEPNDRFKQMVDRGDLLY